MLNSGFGAFEKWESKSSWRLNLRKILNEVKTNADLKSSECKLRSLESMSGADTCLVYGFDNTYDPTNVSLDKLEGKDRVVADLISGVKNGPDHMYFATLLVFQRTVCGKRTSDKKLLSKRTRRDEEVFVGYDTFSEIEIDDIHICKWSPLEKDGRGWYGSFLKGEDEDMFAGGIVNEGGLRKMFVGRTPSASNSESCTFYQTAIVICPVGNILKLDLAGPNVYCNRTYWVLRSGCLVAPRTTKNEIAHHVMKQIRENMTREHMVVSSVYSLQKYNAEMAVDILMETRSFSLILEFISALITALRDWPNNEEEYSDVVTNALIRLHSTLSKYVTYNDKKDDLRHYAQERLTYLAEATRSGPPILTHCQREATFNESAKFSAQVQKFLRGDLEEEDFGPFDDRMEAEKWTKNYFNFVIGDICSSNSLEGEREESIGKYSAMGTIDNAGMVRLKKNSVCVHIKEAKIYELHLASLEKLTPVFGGDIAEHS